MTNLFILIFCFIITLGFLVIVFYIIFQQYCSDVELLRHGKSPSVSSRVKTINSVIFKNFFIIFFFLSNAFLCIYLALKLQVKVNNLVFDKVFILDKSAEDVLLFLIHDYVNTIQIEEGRKLPYTNLNKAIPLQNYTKGYIFSNLVHLEIIQPILDESVVQRLKEYHGVSVCKSCSSNLFFDVTHLITDKTTMLNRGFCEYYVTKDKKFLYRYPMLIDFKQLMKNLILMKNYFNLNGNILLQFETMKYFFVPHLSISELASRIIDGDKECRVFQSSQIFEKQTLNFIQVFLNKITAGFLFPETIPTNKYYVSLVKDPAFNNVKNFLTYLEKYTPKTAEYEMSKGFYPKRFQDEIFKYKLPMCYMDYFYIYKDLGLTPSELEYQLINPYSVVYNHLTRDELLAHLESKGLLKYLGWKKHSPQSVFWSFHTTIYNGSLLRDLFKLDYWEFYNIRTTFNNRSYIDGVEFNSWIFRAPPFFFPLLL